MLQESYQWQLEIDKLVNAHERSCPRRIKSITVDPQGTPADVQVEYTKHECCEIFGANLGYLFKKRDEARKVEIEYKEYLRLTEGR